MMNLSHGGYLCRHRQILISTKIRKQSSKMLQMEQCGRRRSERRNGCLMAAMGDFEVVFETFEKVMIKCVSSNITRRACLFCCYCHDLKNGAASAPHSSIIIPSVRRTTSTMAQTVRHSMHLAMLVSTTRLTET